MYVLQIKGFPTIKFFPQGPKDGSAEEYDGGRTASDIVSWASEKHSEFTPPPEVLQVFLRTNKVYRMNLKHVFLHLQDNTKYKFKNLEVFLTNIENIHF